MKHLVGVLLFHLALGANISLKGKTLRVSCAENAPFFVNGGTGYEGYIVDLLDALAGKLNFKYDINPVGDGRYGSYEPGQDRWTGMVGEVLTGVADMAVADLTITAKREEAVDFSYPFMFTGIGVLYKKTFGFPSISSVEDLANSDVNVGTFYGGSTYNFLKKSKVPALKKLFDRLSGPSAKYLLKSNAEGVEAVIKENGGVAFFMEAPSIQYAVRNNCGLVQVGREIDSKAYGIALPKGSPYRKDLNIAILQLQEEGVLDEIRRKWFDGSGKCENDSPLENLLALMIGY